MNFTKHHQFDKSKMIWIHNIVSPIFQAGKLNLEQVQAQLYINIQIFIMYS